MGKTIPGGLYLTAAGYVDANGNSVKITAAVAAAFKKATGYTLPKPKAASEPEPEPELEPELETPEES